MVILEEVYSFPRLCFDGIPTPDAHCSYEEFVRRFRELNWVILLRRYADDADQSATPQVVAYLFGHQRIDPVDNTLVIHIWLVATHVDHRSRGLMCFLFKEMEFEARQMEISRLTINTDPKYFPDNVSIPY